MPIDLRAKSAAFGANLDETGCPPDTARTPAWPVYRRGSRLFTGIIGSPIVRGDGANTSRRGATTGGDMRRARTWLAAGAGSLGCITPLTLGAATADGVKIGFVGTFSGPAAAIGNDMRDGFNLALDQLGHRMAGKPAEVLFE